MKYLIFLLALTLAIVSPLTIGYSQHPHMHHDETMHHKETELSGTIEGDARIVKVKAFRYGFDPDPIVVKKNKKVRLEVTSADVTHGIAIRDFDINLVAPAGKTETIEFMPERTGTFHIHCSVYCGPGHGNMHGSFIVIE